MSDRKQTPDILGEILAGPAVPAAAAPSASIRRAAAPARRPAEKKPAPEKKTRWEYLMVSFQNHRGWRPRFANGRELDDWTQCPLMPDYIATLGEEGWEVAAAAAGQPMFAASDTYQVFFKRPKGASGLL